MARRTIGRMQRVRVEPFSYLASYSKQWLERRIDMPRMANMEQEIFWGLNRILYRKKFEAPDAKSSEAV